MSYINFDDDYQTVLILNIIGLLSHDHYFHDMKLARTDTATKLLFGSIIKYCEKEVF